MTTLPPRLRMAQLQVSLCKKQKGSRASLGQELGAGEESRTLDLNLGKVALYQLSYSRFLGAFRQTLSASNEERIIDEQYLLSNPQIQPGNSIHQCS